MRFGGFRGRRLEERPIRRRWLFSFFSVSRLRQSFRQARRRGDRGRGRRHNPGNRGGLARRRTAAASRGLAGRRRCGPRHAGRLGRRQGIVTRRIGRRRRGAYRGRGIDGLRKSLRCGRGLGHPATAQHDECQPNFRQRLHASLLPPRPPQPLHRDLPPCSSLSAGGRPDVQQNRQSFPRFYLEGFPALPYDLFQDRWRFVDSPWRFDNEFSSQRGVS